jgi:hypothetical protein
MNCNRGSPIIVNLDSNAAVDHLTSAEDGVLFDLKAKGVKYRVAWTKANLRTAFLAMDRNGNNTIDDGSELFGTATRTTPGVCAPNGFLALQALDSNGDLKIDVADPAYYRLLLWIDQNHDGESQANELTTLIQQGVDVLFTVYTENNRRDRYGNWYRYEGTTLLQNRGGVQVARRVFDVFLVMNFQ